VIEIFAALTMAATHSDDTETARMFAPYVWELTRRELTCWPICGSGFPNVTVRELSCFHGRAQPTHGSSSCCPRCARRGDA
jgi:hypothetical protein